MKYVRTKDGVFKVEDKETDICILTNHGYIYKQDILNQADTIEELVDFVAVKFKWEEIPSVHSLKELYKKAEEKGWDKNQVFDNHKFLIERSEKSYSVEYIKYAIATDKGLIYVAKMNKEGELELLYNK